MKPGCGWSASATSTGEGVATCSAPPPAKALEVSERTVMREWAYARARLAELAGDGPEE